MTKKHQQPAAKPQLEAEREAPRGRVHGLIHVASFVFLVAVTCGLYAKALDIGFFDVDDADYVINNPMIKAVTASNIVRIATTPYFANYSPLHLYSYLMDEAIGGENPRVFHFSSNLWAGLCAGMVYLFAWALVGRWSLAFLAGLLFVVHPTHVEAVAWISSRKDLVAVAFVLPAMMAWLRYRAGGPRRRVWYGTALAFFTLAVAGKLSVIVVPAMWFLMELFVERRRGLDMWIDKLPFAAVVLFFVWRVMGAQPATGYEPDFFILGHTIAKCLWLLTGFGEQVVFRARPPEPGALAASIYSALPVILVLLPWVVRPWLSSKAMTFYYWILLALIPAQGLSFVHPVSDRYLFFPSVALVLLIVWAAGAAIARWGSRARGVAVVMLLLLTASWARATWLYLEEWRDPRSLWHAASDKVSDVNIDMYLGNRYQDAVDRLVALPANSAVPDDLRQLAAAVLRDDPQLAPLLAEWDANNTRGPESLKFREHLLGLAWAQFESATRIKGSRITPNLFFRRGKLQMDRKNWESARAEFQRALIESRSHTSQAIREEMAVRCPYAIGVVYWQEGNVHDALPYIQEAEQVQARVGGRWIPDIAAQRDRLETVVRMRGPKADG